VRCGRVHESCRAGQRKRGDGRKDACCAKEKPRQNRWFFGQDFTFASRTAFSADWPNEYTLRVRVQIIDKSFGNLAILFGFKDPRRVSVRMTKAAEAFLNEYEGVMNATAEE